MDKFKIALEKSQWQLVKELLTNVQAEGVLEHEDQIRLEGITSEIGDQLVAMAACT